MPPPGDVSFNVSIRGSPFTSTPFKTPFRTARKKQFVRPVCDTCEVCHKEYRCHRSYLKHITAHKLKDNASKYPDVERIVEYCKENSNSVTEKLKKYASCGSKGLQYEELLTALSSVTPSASEWQDVLQIILSSLTLSLDKSKFLLPSSILDVLQKMAENLLSDVTKRNQLCDIVLCLHQCERDEVHCVIADYIFCFMKEILNFICASVKKNDRVSSAPEKVVKLDFEDLEAVHYIAGSVVRAFHRKSQAFSNNTGWKKIGLVIEQRLIESDTVPGPPASVKGWTIAQNRGKLFFVSGVLFDFLCGVTEILEKHPDQKRINVEFVIGEVCQSALLLLWDDAVGDSMSEESSYQLMCGMIRSFSQTFGVGRAKKLINATRKKGEASLPLRHRVAPKSTS